MIIDAKQYSGLCPCGQEHAMTTEFCIIESGCMANLPAYLSQAGLSGFSVAVYDENTYHAKGLVRPQVDLEVILPAENLHADNHAVDLLMAQLPAHCDYLIAIGSGSIHDLTRYCAYERNIPFVSCPTAASVDGFCSSVAAMTWHGFKKTLTAVSPKIVVADLDVISQAPMFLTRSGFGDMIGKYIALSDWKIGHLLTGEHFCEKIYTMTREATSAVLESADGVCRGEAAAYGNLIYGLLMSGLAMQLMGNSRPASGAEHHISHLIEMQPESLGLSSTALHGEKVGVGTLLVAGEYHRLKNSTDLQWKDYPAVGEEEVRSVFGEALAASVVQENINDVAAGITGAHIAECWEDICRVIDEIPSVETLLRCYETLEIKSTLTDIDVPAEKESALLNFSPMVRNRLTLMRLRRALCREV